MSLSDDRVVALMDVIATLVGDRLSEIPTQTGTLPSIIFARDTNTKPDYPYITIDSVTAVKSGGRTLRRYYKEDDGDGVEGEATDVLWNATLNIKAYGTEAYDILQQLDQGLEFSWVREALRRSVNIGILEQQQVQKVPALLATEYSDDAVLPIIINYITTYVNTPVEYGDYIAQVNIGNDVPDLPGDNGIDNPAAEVYLSYEGEGAEEKPVFVTQDFEI